MRVRKLSVQGVTAISNQLCTALENRISVSLPTLLFSHVWCTKECLRTLATFDTEWAHKEEQSWWVGKEPMKESVSLQRKQPTRQEQHKRELRKTMTEKNARKYTFGSLHTGPWTRAEHGTLSRQLPRGTVDSSCPSGCEIWTGDKYRAKLELFLES